jgi:hypothetical protein
MWEIKEEQSINMIKIIAKKKEEYIVLSLKNMKDELKSIKKY